MLKPRTKSLIGVAENFGPRVHDVEDSQSITQQHRNKLVYVTHKSEVDPYHLVSQEQKQKVEYR